MLDSRLLKLIRIHTKYFAKCLHEFALSPDSVTTYVGLTKNCASKKCQHLWPGRPVFQDQRGCSVIWHKSRTAAFYAFNTRLIGGSPRCFPSQVLSQEFSQILNSKEGCKMKVKDTHSLVQSATWQILFFSTSSSPNDGNGQKYTYPEHTSISQQQGKSFDPWRSVIKQIEGTDMLFIVLNL